MSAGNCRLDGYLVADLKPLYALADGRYNAARLMTQSKRSVQLPVLKLSFLIEVKVRSTYAYIFQLNLKLAFARLRNVTLYPLQLLLSSQNTYFHFSFHCFLPLFY